MRLRSLYSLRLKAPASDTQNYAFVAGIATFATTAGVATYASTAGIATENNNIWICN